MTSPIRPTDDEARNLARGLLEKARFAAIAVSDPDTGAPMVTRIACIPGPDGLPLSLTSDLSHHTTALKADPTCSLLIGEPGPKGDPLTHPRLTLQARAGFVRHPEPDFEPLARHFVSIQPKAKLYIGFADFQIVTFDTIKAYLNGGFGKAFVLAPEDLA